MLRGSAVAVGQGNGGGDAAVESVPVGAYRTGSLGVFGGQVRLCSPDK